MKQSKYELRIRIHKQEYTILDCYKPKSGYIDFLYPDGESGIRNPTPKQREIMLLNLIMRNSGKQFTVPFFAKLFAVSDRTIQSILKKFQENGWITREQDKTKEYRKGNVVKYIATENPITGKNYTYELMMRKDNPLHIRDFHWEEFKFIPHCYIDYEAYKNRHFYSEWIKEYDLD